MSARVSNLVEVLEHSVQRFEGSRLFGTKRQGAWQWITYGQFGALVDKVRGGLAQMGVERGQRVALIIDNSVEWAATAYATYGLGAQLVPLYEEQRPDEWATILKDSGASVAIVADARIADHLRALIGPEGALRRVICVRAEAPSARSGKPVAPPSRSGEPEAPQSRSADTWAELVEAGALNPVASLRPAPEEVAGLIYTSGTTDQPKGVILTHGNFAHNVNGVREQFSIQSDDCSLSFLPWAHSFGQTCELHCMIANGAAVALAESIAALSSNIQEIRPTLLFAVPRIFTRLYSAIRRSVADEGGVKQRLFEVAMANAARRRALVERGQTSWLVERQHKTYDKLVLSKIRARFGGRLRYAFSGGAALSLEVAAFIDDLGVPIYEGYGLSETSPIVTANSPLGRRLGSVGRPLEGVTVRIEPVDHIKEPGSGEVIVYGPNVMSGYHNLPEETAAAFTPDGGFRTGDIGHIDPDGFLFITGRIKEQYKLESGKFVVPTPLENALRLSPFINQVMIYGDNRPYNVVLVVPDFEALGRWANAQGRSIEIDALMQDADVLKLLKAQLAEYGQRFRGYEHPRKLSLIKEEFSTANDMLTPKLSLKRRNIVARHRALLDAMYDPA